MADVWTYVSLLGIHLLIIGVGFGIGYSLVLNGFRNLVSVAIAIMVATGLGILWFTPSGPAFSGFILVVVALCTIELAVGGLIGLVVGRYRLRRNDRN